MDSLPGGKVEPGGPAFAPSFPTRRAERPRPPSPTPAVVKTQEDTAAYLSEREKLERHSVLRGLLWLAVIVLLVGLARGGLHRAFYAGWWRQW